jgi:hypothetical protein
MLEILLKPTPVDAPAHSDGKHSRLFTPRLFRRHVRDRADGAARTCQLIFIEHMRLRCFWQLDSTGEQLCHEEELTSG